MIYHKSIDIPRWENAADYVLHYLSENTKIIEQKKFWNSIDQSSPAVKKIQEILSPLDLKIFRMYCIIITDSTDNRENVHVDWWKPDHPVPQARINIPLTENCKQSVTHFYRCQGEPQKQLLSSGQEYCVWPQEMCEIVTSYVLDKPMIIRPGEPHSIDVSKCIDPRICLTMITIPDCAMMLNQ
jgi:hypothetical protein